MTIKKAYQELHDFLAANKDKKVSAIFDQAVEFMSAQRMSAENTAIRNEKGEVVAILDSYSRKWAALVGSKAVEFGVKANTSTGLNPMSKAHLNQWNKQQTAAKKAGSELLTLVAKGEVKPTEIEAKLAEIEEQRKAVVDLGEGFESKEKLVAYLQKEGVKLNEDTVTKAAA